MSGAGHQLVPTLPAPRPGGAGFSRFCSSFGMTFAKCSFCFALSGSHLDNLIAKGNRTRKGWGFARFFPSQQRVGKQHFPGDLYPTARQEGAKRACGITGMRVWSLGLSTQKTTHHPSPRWFPGRPCGGRGFLRLELMLACMLQRAIQAPTHVAANGTPILTRLLKRVQQGDTLNTGCSCNALLTRCTGVRILAASAVTGGVWSLGCMTDP